MSSSSDKVKDKNISGKRTRTSNFCSTPLVENICRPSSIGISVVDTNSSSSTKNKILRVDSDRRQVKKNKVYRKKLTQKAKKKKEEKGKEVDKERKENKKEKKKKKRKKSNQRRRSDIDWETCDESLRQSPKFQDNVLFEDAPSPEQIRDASHFVHDRLDSPILGFREWETDRPEKNIFETGKEILPTENLPFSRVQFYDSDEEEDVPTLKKQDKGRTYQGMRNKRVKDKIVKDNEHKEWLVDVAVPTASSDLLWDNFISNNYEKISKYIARPGNDKQQSRHGVWMDINDNKGHSLEELSNHGQKSVKEKYEIPLNLRKKKDVARGYCNKFSRTFIRTCDTYEFPESDKNNEFIDEMSLNQYCAKCKAEKANIADLDSSSPSLTYWHRIEQKSENTNVKTARKKPKVATTNVTDLELHKTSEIYKFASEASTSKINESDSTVASLKRKGEDIRNDKEHKRKKFKLAKTKSKPVVKSIESISAVLFKKGERKWQMRNRD